MIKTEDYEIFRRNVSTLKETSKDNHDGTDCYMTESDLKVINFDRVKDDYIAGLNLSENPRSNDALFLSPGGKPFFIEFKNGFLDSGRCYEVRGKIYDSMLILMDIIGEGIGYTRKNMDYILVYNQKSNTQSEADPPAVRVRESPSRDKIGKRLMALGGGNYIRFGLDRFRNYCFKGVFTYTEDEFQKHFVDCFRT